MKNILTHKALLMLTVLAFVASNTQTEETNTTPILSCSDKKDIKISARNGATAKYLGAGTTFSGLALLCRFSNHDYHSAGSFKAFLSHKGLFTKGVLGFAGLGIAAFAFPVSRLLSYVGYNRSIKNAYTKEINERIELNKQLEIQNAMKFYNQNNNNNNSTQNS